MPSSFTIPMHIEGVGPSQKMVEKNTSSPMYMQSYDNDMEPIVREYLVRVIDSIVMIVENYIDILLGNDDDNVELFDEDDGNKDIMDMEDNENIENDASLLGGGEHDVPSPVFRKLNWDVIDSMADKDLTACTSLWNELDELFKGLWFESKVDLQYVVKRYSICRNQHLIVIEFEPDMWVVKCKKWSEGCNWRLCVCRLKSHGLFEITKYIDPHTCVYPKLSQDHS